MRASAAIVEAPDCTEALRRSERTRLNSWTDGNRILVRSHGVANATTNWLPFF